MANKIDWTPELGASLRLLVDVRGCTIREAALRLGLSRTYAQRQYRAVSEQHHHAICCQEREAAGAEPLKAGHPISWGAIRLDHANHAR